MRTNVSFSYPAKFVSIPEVEDVLAVSGALWFVDLLKRIPNLHVESELCQEDWGVVAFCRRGERPFWIGLSLWPEGEQAWLAHVHHGSFAWLQRFSKAGKEELRRLVLDLHQALARDPAVSQIAWYHERGMRTANPQGALAPDVP
jgi:hypothetical protein